MIKGTHKVYKHITTTILRAYKGLVKCENCGDTESLPRVAFNRAIKSPVTWA